MSSGPKRPSPGSSCRDMHAGGWVVASRRKPQFAYAETCISRGGVSGHASGGGDRDDRRASRGDRLGQNVTDEAKRPGR